MLSWSFLGLPLSFPVDPATNHYLRVFTNLHLPLAGLNLLLDLCGVNWASKSNFCLNSVQFRAIVITFDKSVVERGFLGRTRSCIQEWSEGVEIQEF